MIPGSVPFPEAVAAARATHGEAIAEAVSWAAADGRPVDPDVLAPLPSAEDDDRQRHPGGWDRERFYGFFRNGIGNWCVLTGCPYPHEILPETLWLWLHHRAVSGRWPPGDESLHDLLEAPGRARPAGPRATRSSPSCASGSSGARSGRGCRRTPGR